MINWSKCPSQDSVLGIKEWVENGSMAYLGAFSGALMQNDFMNVMRRADDSNLELLQEWASFLYWEIPNDCFRNPELWKTRGGLNGIAAAADEHIRQLEADEAKLEVEQEARELDRR